MQNDGIVYKHRVGYISLLDIIYTDFSFVYIVRKKEKKRSIPIVESVCAIDHDRNNYLFFFLPGPSPPYSDFVCFYLACLFHYLFIFQFFWLLIIDLESNHCPCDSFFRNIGRNIGTRNDPDAIHIFRACTVHCDSNPLCCQLMILHQCQCHLVHLKYL